MAMSNDQEERDKKRQKLLTDDLICPITLELPVDPVVAQDGRMYERSEIEHYINGKSGAELTSPWTNKRMGNSLVPLIQCKNLIQTMIETGIITGDSAENWNKKVEEKKNMEALINCAEKAEDSTAPLAMLFLGSYYKKGTGGFKKDLKLAYTWNKRAHDSGWVMGTERIAYDLLAGAGVTRNEKDGIMFLRMAAERGSSTASYELGLALVDGLYGLTVDKPEGIKWLKKSLSGECKGKHLDEDRKRKAQEKLDELTD